jgi:bacterioferritin-associated ferredoxin
MFKAHGMVPENGVVMAGSGPLLLLLAWQYLHAGVRIDAILDLTPMQNHLRALPHLPRAMLARHYLSKGLAYKKDLKQAGVKTYRSVSELRAQGDLQLSSVSFKHKAREVKLDTELLLVHFGVIPNTHLSRAAGCNHAWDSNQQCWRPVIDRWGRSTVDRILIAGDSGGIVGARTAEHAGQLTALQAVHDLGVISRQERDASGHQARKWLREDQHVRPFLENYFRIPDKCLAATPDNTIICRCEEITAGDIRQAVADGYTDNNRIKSLTRCGMGPCQGRQCDHSVAQIIACAGGEKPGLNQHYRGRPPVTPLRLGQLASLYPEERE